MHRRSFLAQFLAEKNVEAASQLEEPGGLERWGCGELERAGTQMEMFQVAD